MQKQREVKRKTARDGLHFIAIWNFVLAYDLEGLP
jgi:hypothetical protein